MEIQLLRHDGLYRVGAKGNLERNQEMLVSKHPSIPEDIEATVKDLLTIVVGKPRILDFVHLRPITS
jgi:hypothetical protein